MFENSIVSDWKTRQYWCKQIDCEVAKQSLCHARVRHQVIVVGQRTAVNGTASVHSGAVVGAAAEGSARAAADLAICAASSGQSEQRLAQSELELDMDAPSSSCSGSSHASAAKLP